MKVVKISDVGLTPSPQGDPMIARGQVDRQILFDDKVTGGFGAAIVKFSKGARLSFHSHPDEQILYITEGKGILATKDKEYIVTPGMIVFIPPGEVHYHGATDDSSFAHLAIYKGQSIVVK